MRLKALALAVIACLANYPAFSQGLIAKDIYTPLEKEMRSVQPQVAAYIVKPGLANIVNRKLYTKLLDKNMIALIQKNGFAATPTSYVQMYHVYENNEYQRPAKIPAFITTDSMLHTYHVFYNYTLRKLENDKLYKVAIQLTNAMVAASKKDLSMSKTPEAKKAAIANLAYFSVANNLLTGAAPPKVVSYSVKQDLARIAAHTGREKSSIFKFKIEFTQFVPRGHYTRTENLKKYFKAMMWYGLIPMPLPNKYVPPTVTVQALMITRNLKTLRIGKQPASAVWEQIYEPTVFYVGKADDYTFRSYAPIIKTIYGNSPSVNDFADPTKLQQFVKAAGALPKPQIAQYVADPEYPTGPQFRFMGQRFIPDSRILQELTHPKVGLRGFPLGLDVFAALGSDRAYNIADKYYGALKFPGYDTQMQKMREEIKNTTLAKWQSNLYWGWLWTLDSIIEPAKPGYPSFMRNQAWQDKSLFTALGSWTELRHDTILYAKQSVSECGGAEEDVSQPKGYVEPNLEFWTRMKWLNTYSMQGLMKRGLLDEEQIDKFKKLGDMIEFCRRITIKELTNKKVTWEEHEQISIYGSELEGLTLSFAGGDMVTDTDKDMALVADVHTSSGEVLEEGNGRAGAIYVVVPIQGKLYLTRGAIYTQYEFIHPSSDRMTDEKWQKLLKGNQFPKIGEWTKSFFINKKVKSSQEFREYSGGC